MKPHSRLIKIIAQTFALILSLAALTGSLFSAHAASPSTLQVTLRADQAAVGADQPVMVHGWIYDLREGLLRDLDMNE